MVKGMLRKGMVKGPDWNMPQSLTELMWKERPKSLANPPPTLAERGIKKGWLYCCCLAVTHSKETVEKVPLSEDSPSW